MADVAVIGAAGYVGRRLCAELGQRGHRVRGVIRPGSGFLLDRLGVEWVPIEEAEAAGPFSVVVNLAYPTSGSVYTYPEQNRRLLDRIATLAGAEGCVIHTSTQAVFGMALEYDQIAGPIPNRRDFLYVESKLEMENLLVERLPGARLDIVRLGNVWGPGSATWTAELARRLLFGDPVTVIGSDGLSNVTEISNLVSYLSYLVDRSGSAKLGRFHHLAELGDVPWGTWIGEMSDALKVEPVAAPRPAYSSSTRQEIRTVLAANNPLNLARRLNGERFSGSVMRSAVRALPPRLSHAARRRAGGVLQVRDGNGPEDLFLTVTGCETRFGPVVDPDWSPPVEARDSIDAVTTWLATVGFK